jgi:hypothetical protein
MSALDSHGDHPVGIVVALVVAALRKRGSRRAVRLQAVCLAQLLHIINIDTIVDAPSPVNTP